ncbi:GNAT family N-acetyltransferase [Nonomuraea insulae]|uniref:GNAT family N-acetyltransferase n=1 Tax=Nonomuraea insulae TaxID=1616787 RepID=A0ABW1D5V4_9ACTN
MSGPAQGPASGPLVRETGGPAVTIRPYQPFDLPGIYRVCLATGDSGRDAGPLHANPDLLGHVWAGPYPVADPGLTFVAADALGVAGYVLATADTVAFEAWRQEHWWPVLREQYPAELATDPGDGMIDWLSVAHLHRAAPPAEELYERYPAHLHIDLLPRAQGRGLGRALIGALFGALRARGVPGLHLGVGSGNPGAHAFYLRMGFTELRRGDWGSTMVIDLG